MPMTISFLKPELRTDTWWIGTWPDRAVAKVGTCLLSAPTRHKYLTYEPCKNTFGQCSGTSIFWVSTWRNEPEDGDHIELAGLPRMA
jgi:hypothetical protein